MMFDLAQAKEALANHRKQTKRLRACERVAQFLESAITEVDWLGCRVPQLQEEKQKLQDAEDRAAVLAAQIERQELTIRSVKLTEQLLETSRREALAWQTLAQHWEGQLCAPLRSKP